MKLYSYVVARDYGFAPNPFYGVCTLATCKPKIRSVAQVGDWVIGTGSSVHKKKGYLVYVMRVTETMTFNEYWTDIRFIYKKPNLQGSKKQAFGDNIYFQDESGVWHQEDSHHSFPGGVVNEHNLLKDTGTNKVLISTDFAYWGQSGPKIPDKFRNYNAFDICAGIGHKCNFPESLVNEFITWFRSLESSGFLGSPLDWSRTP